MAELAKTHITVVDESTYATGINTLIPLYVIATKSNKVVDETTGEIALGTTKDFAGQVEIVTSQREVIDRYGVPYFAELNGTIQQGDERNEYGLYGLYDAMGTTSLAYVLRADIDLGQLESREEEPTSNVKNGTFWIDLNNSVPGIFYAERQSSSTTRPSDDWKVVEHTIYVDEKPEDTVGDLDDFAIQIKDGVQTVWKKSSSAWVDAATNVSNIFKQPSVKYPETYVQNDLWMKTTAINGGMQFSLKKWVESSEAWKEELLPVCTSFIDAEAALGSSLGSNSLCFKLDSEKNCSGKVYKYSPSTISLKISADNVPSISENKSITLRYVEDGSLKIITVKMKSTSTIDSIISEFESKLTLSNSKAVSVKNESDKLVIYSDISDMELSGDVTNFGFNASKAGYNVPENVELWEEYTDVIASVEEPRAPATEGTMWFNDDLKVDIMVGNGTVWQGYKVAYPNASIYVTSEDPTSNATIADYSLWVDTDEDDYPTIRRWFGGKWETLDNTDQSTPNGVVFADARQYMADGSVPTYEVDDESGEVSNSLFSDSSVDPDCVNPQTYPAGIILFNTRFSTNNVKEYKENPFEGLYDENGNYAVGGYEGTIDEDNLPRWVTASGNAEDGSGLFGRKAQRRMVVNAMAAAIKSNEDIRTYDYDFFFATAPGYPELDDELISLNVEKKEMFEIISDTPSRLAPNAKKIQDWATNANNAVSHGQDGRVLKNTYVTRQYPPMGLTSNVDGNEIAVPSSIAKMRNLLVLPRGQIAAGTQYGQVTNLASVGYITDEDEYASIVVKDGLGEVLVAQSINPIMPRRNTGLLFWGEATEHPVTSSLSDEHAIITLLRLKRQLETFCQPYFFRINTEALRADFERGIVGILNEYIGTNELYDYAVSMERNTPETIQRKELWCDISIEIAKGIEQIYIPIHVVATGSISGS